MLSRAAILNLIKSKNIVIDPYEPAMVGPNSIDLHFGDSMKEYVQEIGTGFDGVTPRPALPGWTRIHDPLLPGCWWDALDPELPAPELVDVPLTSCGRWLLKPGHFYLGITKERTKTIGVVPTIQGRSTCGRLSVEVHRTAGIGDNGFDGRWTLEITTALPVLIRPGSRLLQVYFEPCWAGQMPFDLRDLMDQTDLYGGPKHHYQGSNEIRPYSALPSAQPTAPAVPVVDQHPFAALLIWLPSDWTTQDGVLSFGKTAAARLTEDGVVVHGPVIRAHSHWNEYPGHVTMLDALRNAGWPTDGLLTEAPRRPHR